MHKTVLVLAETVDDYLPLLEQAGYRLIRAPSPQQRADAIRRHANQIDAVLTCRYQTPRPWCCASCRRSLPASRY